MTHYFIGIDPGLEGGVVVLRKNGAKPFFTKMPTNGKRHPHAGHRAVDVIELLSFLSDFPPSGSLATVERQFVLPNQAGVETTLANYGRILSVLEMMRMPYVVVHPKQWQADLFGKSKYDKIKDGYIFCLKHNLPVGDRRVHEGIVDASCIAFYTMTKEG